MSHSLCFNHSVFRDSGACLIAFVFPSLITIAIRCCRMDEEEIQVRLDNKKSELEASAKEAEPAKKYDAQSP